MSRFDIAPQAKLQSRDGSFAKGGLIRNGFMETQKNGEVWSWQRPALLTGEAAPLTGKGQGLYLVGTTLWGVFGTNTSTSYRLELNNRTPFTLNAGQVDASIFGYDDSGGPVVGSLSPSSFKGAIVISLYSSHPTETSLILNGNLDSNFLTRLRIASTVLFTADAAFQNLGGSVEWAWPGALPITGTGTYLGDFV